MSKYALIQEKFQTLDPEALRETLVRAAGMTRPDATRIARKAHGILTDRLTLTQASAACQALRGEGYAVRVFPAEKVVPLGKARVVRWLEMNDTYLALPLGYHGQTQQIPWSGVFVISAGQVSEIAEQQSEVISMRWGEVITETKTQRQSRRIHVTELIAVAESGNFLHVRLPANEMNYERVLGQQLEANLFARYLAMLGELVRRATAALISPETRQLLSERKEHYVSTDGDYQYYAEEQQFAEYNRWLLQMVILAESQDVGDSSSA